MNWRRGLWRTWIVLSTLWIVVLGSTGGFREIVENSKILLTPPDPQLLADAQVPVPSPPEPQSEGSFTDQLLEGGYTLVDPSDPPKGPFTIVRTPQDSRDEEMSVAERLLRDQSVSDQYWEELQTFDRAWLLLKEVDTRNKAKQRLIKSTTFLFGPPFALLVAGLMVVWAISGFTRPTPS